LARRYTAATAPDSITGDFAMRRLACLFVLALLKEAP
jgi:hypothetical protein